MSTLLRISALYFIIVFSAGFALGVVRVLAVADLIGERYAELAEMPVMLLICGIAAHYLTGRYATSLNLGRAALVGMIALLMLLAIEFSFVLSIRGLTMAEYLAGRDPVAGGAYIIGLIWFAAAPMIFCWRRSR